MVRLSLLCCALSCWGLAACQLFFDGADPSECADDPDCPSGRICISGTCEVGQRVDAAVDMAVVDLAPPMPDAAPPDMTPDAVVDAGPDAGDGGPVLPFADGRCFTNDADVWVRSGDTDTHVPRGLCTPWGIVWSEGRAGGPTLRLLSAAGGPELGEDGPALWPGSPLLTDGRMLVFLTPWPDADGPPTAVRLDLAAPNTPLPLSNRGLPNSDPARAEGVSAHVEHGPDGSAVVFTFDDDNFDTCQRADVRQWGVALSADRAAWFERPVGGARTSLVVTDGMACADRVVRPVDGLVELDSRLVSVGPAFYWIEATREGRRRIAGLRPDVRGRLRPVVIETANTPVELTGSDTHWLGVVTYQPGRYVLDMVDTRSGDSRPVSSASARQPVIHGQWLMWAEAAMFVPWELRYVDLATLDR